MHLIHGNFSFQANCFSVEDNVLNIFWLMKILEVQDQTVSVSYQVFRVDNYFFSG